MCLCVFSQGAGSSTFFDMAHLPLTVYIVFFFNLWIHCFVVGFHVSFKMVSPAVAGKLIGNGTLLGMLHSLTGPDHLRHVYMD